MSTPPLQAWQELPEAEVRRAFEQPWPAPDEGCLCFVLDMALLGLPRDDLRALYFDLAEKMLAVFRELVPPGGWLYALDWHHTNHRLFPHVPFEQGATLAEMTGRWGVSIHPDGDPEHLFAAPDFQFVYACRYEVREQGGRYVETETYELWGQRLLQAVERHPPALFRRARQLPAGE